MLEKIQAVRGMNDTLPEQCILWRELEQILRHCLSKYGYQEIRFPLLESTQLFKRSIGEVTDIVEKEMYSFADLNGDSLTLRPEGTAGCLRACIEHGLLYNQQQKLWYLGAMFRHERPQKGRYRQFHQFGVEAIGMDGVAIELELIAISKRIFFDLGLDSFVTLQINTLGEMEERRRYKETLVAFLNQNSDKLDEDSRRRLNKNPLRILDSKNPEVQALLRDAPKLLDSLGEESRLRFSKLCQGLESMGIAYTINPNLVRGLDYYGQVVFEWVSDALGAQGTVCAGGRYDGLVAQLGGQPSPAIGFAMGLERVLLLMDTVQACLKPKRAPSIFIMATEENGILEALRLAEELRNDTTLSCTIITHTSGGSFKSQFKKADKSGAELALILGEDEIQNQQLSIKNLRKEEDQLRISRDHILQYLKDYFGEQ